MLHILGVLIFIVVMIWVVSYLWCGFWCLCGYGEFCEIYDSAWYFTKVFIFGYSPMVIVCTMPKEVIQSAEVLKVLMIVTFAWAVFYSFATMEEEDKL